MKVYFEVPMVLDLKIYAAADGGVCISQVRNDDESDVVSIAPSQVDSVIKALKAFRADCKKEVESL